MEKVEERDVILENLPGKVCYWACVKDKYLATETDPNGKTILLKGCEDANKLDQLLALFFTT